MPGQTAQTQIRLLQSSLIRVYTVCHYVCIVWTHYSKVEPYSSNFRVITTKCLGVRIFRKFTVGDIISVSSLCHDIRKPVFEGVRPSKNEIGQFF